MITLKSHIARVLTALAIVAGFATVSPAANLCLRLAGGPFFVLKNVSPSVSKAKAKPFGGLRVTVGGFMGPLYGVTATQTTKNTLMISLTVPRVELNGAGTGSIYNATEFHTIASTPTDGVWDVGEGGNDCHWGQQGGAIAGLNCETITAVDCSTVPIP